jgi:hypothetical protein
MFIPFYPLRFYPLDLGLAFGLVAVVFSLLMMIAALATDNPAAMDSFKSIFPGFNLTTGLGFVSGVLWSFIDAFAIGFFTALLYNWRVGRYTRNSVPHSH